MPMTFDTYSSCSYNCLYCFSYFQKSHTMKGYLRQPVRHVNVDKIKRLFTTSKPENEPERLFHPYIQKRYVMQWGGLSDPFDRHEERFGVTLELLKFFDEIDYPLSFSTKGAWWTQDRRYMDIIKRHTHNWHFKVSIITADPFKARLIERGVSTPQERLAAIKRLADQGTHVTLRLRPYIIGVSDDYRALITQAKEAGVDSVTTEFFCLEARANKALHERYDALSHVAGRDLWALYRDESTQKSGYRRLSRKIKGPIVLDMQQLVHASGLRFYVSDAHFKELSDYCCCCGVPPTWNVCKGHFAEALQIAKHDPKLEVSWSQIGPALKEICGHVEFIEEINNADMTEKHALLLGRSIYDVLHEWWNSPKQARSPARYFGIMHPLRLDKHGDIVYGLKHAQKPTNAKK